MYTRKYCTLVNRQAFPRKLFEILCREPGDVIGWSSPGSSSFVIKDMDEFVTYILEKYFRHQKYSSFQRQLNLYGFRKVSKGSEAGAYSHKYFVDGRSDLLSKVRRMPQSAAALGGAKTSGKSSVIIEGGRHSESPTALDSEDMSEEEDEEDERNGDRKCVDDLATSCGPLRAVFSNALASFDFDENTDTAITSPGCAGPESKVIKASRTPPIPNWSMSATAVASADPLLDQLDLEGSKPGLDFVVSSAPQKATFDGFVFDAHRLSPTPSGPSLGSTAAGFAACFGGGSTEVSGADSDSEKSFKGDSTLSGTITNEPGRPPVAIAVTQSASLVADLCFTIPNNSEPLDISHAPSLVDAVDAGLSRGICKLTVAPFDTSLASAEAPVRARSLSISSDDWAIGTPDSSPSTDLFAAVESAGMARW